MSDKRLGLVVAGSAVALCALIGGQPLLAQSDGADGNWAAVAQCGTILKDKDRLACVDAVLERAGVLASAQKRAEQKVAESKEDFGLSASQKEAAARKQAAAAPTPAIPATPPATVARPAPPPPPPPVASVDRIVTSVTKAFDPGNRLYVFITAEGQIWQQSEMKDIGLPPKAGTAFTIEKSSLGGFICQAGKYKVFRCKRQA